jgi:hypothetical protein
MGMGSSCGGGLDGHCDDAHSNCPENTTLHFSDRSSLHVIRACNRALRTLHGHFPTKSGIATPIPTRVHWRQHAPPCPSSLPVLSSPPVDRYGRGPSILRKPSAGQCWALAVRGHATQPTTFGQHDAKHAQGGQNLYAPGSTNRQRWETRPEGSASNARGRR